MQTLDKMAISACVVKLKYSQVTHMVKMIEARPCIWDPKCRDYHNRDIKAKAFNEVAKALNTDGKRFTNNIDLCNFVFA